MEPDWDSCTPSMGAHAFRCDLTDSGSRTLVIILGSRLLNLVLDCVCASVLLECRWAVRLLVWAKCHWRFPCPPLPSPLALQPTSLSDGLTGSTGRTIVNKPFFEWSPQADTDVTQEERVEIGRAFVTSALSMSLAIASPTGLQDFLFP